MKELTQIGLSYHRETILENSRRNVPYITKTIRDLKGTGKARALVVSAGPSLYRNGTLKRFRDSNFSGNIIAIDGSYIQCLKAGIIPDYVVTLDPHPTRVVRWFGDSDFEKNSQGDDYFARQDLDVDFRANSEVENASNFRLVNEHSERCMAVVATTVSASVVARLQSAKFDCHWFAPLIDDPQREGLTQEISRSTGCPSLNTGGTVGTTAWAFAHSILGCRKIAVIGMDLGYYPDTPLKQTQSYHMLNGDPRMYQWEDTPYGRFFTDPTYFFYRQGFLDLLKNNDCTVTNCTGAGMFYGPNVVNMELEDWLKSSS